MSKDTMNKVQLNRKVVRTALIIISFLIGLSASFIMGVNIGFEDGFSHSSYLKSLDSVFTNAILLNEIREDETDKAINLLEEKLDGAIIEHDVSKKPSFAFNFVPFSHIFDTDFDKDLQLFKKAIEYRKRYPSINKNANIRKSVDSHLADIEKKITK